MSDFKLTATTPLNGASESIGGLELRETNFEIVSVAIPPGGEGALAKQVKSAFGTGLPAAGGSTRSKDGTHHFLWTGPDQILVLGAESGPDFEATMNAALADKGYVTLQSDNWVMIEITGPDCREMLCRVSMFDLDPDMFVIGDVRRGMMEHMNAILTRTGDDAFLLLSASSSALSLWSALTHAAHTVEGLKALA